MLSILKWFLFVPVYIFIWFVKFPLAPIAVLLFSSKDKRHLVFCKWLETIDNDLSGDQGWKDSLKGDPLSFWNRVKWLWRNGGNWFNYWVIGVVNDARFVVEHQWEQDTKNFWQRSDGAWQYRATKKTFLGTWTPYIGWGLFGQVEERCKFTFTFLRFNK
jgi:hypothetical protein